MSLDAANHHPHPPSLYPFGLASSDPPVVTGDLRATVDEALETIRQATKGFGTDESKLIRALASQNPTSRYHIAVRYPSVYGGKKETSLVELIDSECGSRREYAKALKWLAMAPHFAEADMVEMGTKGLGTKEALLYPLLCGRTNAEMTTLRTAYFDVYDKDLAMEIGSETKGTLRAFFLQCLQGAQQTYNAEYHDKERAEYDAEAVREACKGWGTNDKQLFKIICRSPPEHLQAVDAAYSAKYGKSLTDAVKKELGGDVEDAVVFCIGMKLNPYETVAQLVHQACKGMGTDEKLLVMTLIRYQAILKEVDQAYQVAYGKSLVQRIKSETGGLLDDVLVEIVNCMVDA